VGALLPPGLIAKLFGGCEGRYGARLIDGQRRDQQRRKCNAESELLHLYTLTLTATYPFNGTLLGRLGRLHMLPRLFVLEAELIDQLRIELKLLFDRYR